MESSPKSTSFEYGESYQLEQLENIENDIKTTGRIELA